MEELLRRIEHLGFEAAAEGRDVVDLPPFRLLLDPISELVYLNYAVPMEPLPERGLLRAQLRRLDIAFRRRARRPRFEFTEELWPTLAVDLAEEGYVLEGRYPKMAALPHQLQPVSAPGVEVRLLEGDVDEAVLHEFLELRALAFGLELSPSPEERAQTRANLQSGAWRMAIAQLEDSMVGIGAVLAAEGVGELAGVGTLPLARRRGVASSLSSRLVEDHFLRQGVIAWLSAGSEIAEAVYRRIGFRRVATQAMWIGPP